jgi:hypothetical protein
MNLLTGAAFIKPTPQWYYFDQFSTVNPLGLMSALTVHCFAQGMLCSLGGFARALQSRGAFMEIVQTPAAVLYALGSVQWAPDVLSIAHAVVDHATMGSVRLVHALQGALGGTLADWQYWLGEAGVSVGVTNETFATREEVSESRTEWN